MSNKVTLVPKISASFRQMKQQLWEEGFERIVVSIKALAQNPGQSHYFANSCLKFCMNAKNELMLVLTDATLVSFTERGFDAPAQPVDVIDITTGKPITCYLNPQNCILFKTPDFSKIGNLMLQFYIPLVFGEKLTIETSIIAQHTHFVLLLFLSLLKCHLKWVTIFWGDWCHFKGIVQDRNITDLQEIDEMRSGRHWHSLEGLRELKPKALGGQIANSFALIHQIGLYFFKAINIFSLQEGQTTIICDSGTSDKQKACWIASCNGSWFKLPPYKTNSGYSLSFYFGFNAQQKKSHKEFCNQPYNTEMLALL